MSAAAEKFASYDDVLAAPRHRVAELVRGQLITSPRPAPRHAQAGSGLGAKLFTRFDEGDGGPGGWRILFEPELHLGSNVLVPDIGGWREERMPRLPSTPYFELAPDFCCEVLSPSTANFDRVTKMPLYAAHGVAHVWLVDPLVKTLEVYALKGEAYLLHATYGNDASIHAPPFDAVPIELARLWRD
ncbi:MAG: Uma2 family endonuclease [Deltaproteobacteria bacterium]|nr:Uma2 family endonuclease [Deltaproteobacteria bacterium]